MGQGRRNEADGVITPNNGYVVSLPWAKHIFGVSEHSVRKWPVVPVRGDKAPILYNIIELAKYRFGRFEATIKKLKKKIQDLESENNTPNDMLALSRAEHQTIQNARLKSELLDKRAVEEVVLAIISRFRQEVLSVPSRISSQLAATETRQDAYNVLVNEMRSLLVTLEAFDISDCHEDIDYLDQINSDDDEDPTQIKEDDLDEAPVKRKAGRPRKNKKE